MSNTTKSRGKGLGEELAGKLEKGVGKVVGSDVMVEEGDAKEREGIARQEVAKAGERVKGTVEEAVGKVKAGVGRAFRDGSTELEGEAEALKGRARQAANPPRPKEDDEE